MARFQPLEVVDIRRETRDSVVVSLKSNNKDTDYSFIPGQYLTFRRDFNGDELRRSYSICSSVGDEFLQVGIKRVDGGVFSTWANEELTVGTVLEAMPPMGTFHIPTDAGNKNHYLGFAAGSGITPLLSIIKSRLAAEPESKFTLVYGNSQINTIMFKEDLEHLKNIYMQRFSLIHIINQKGQDIDLFSGRIDREKSEELLDKWIPLANIHTTFICGPEEMMLTVSDVLKNRGVPKERIKFELFTSSQKGRKQEKPQVTAKVQNSTRACVATVILDGAAQTFEFSKNDVSILDAALDNSMDVPYSCKAGICSTCRARILEGEVEMLVNHALEDYEVQQGYVLSCQCFPLTDTVVMSFDE